MLIRNSKGQFAKKVVKPQLKVNLKPHPVPVEIRKYIDGKFEMMMIEQRKFLLDYFVNFAETYDKFELEWD
jgi:hypothetical protein